MANILLSGSIGSGGAFAILGFANINITANTDHVITVPAESSNLFLKVTSDGTSTGIRKVVAPLFEGEMFIVKNATTEGFDIEIVGTSGTGVFVPPGQTMICNCDGANYNCPLSASSGGAWDPTVANHANTPYQAKAQYENVAFDSSIGAVTIISPLAPDGVSLPIDGQEFAVQSQVASATPCAVIAAGGGVTIQSPSDLSFGSPVGVSGQALGSRWKFRAVDRKWILKP